MESSYRNPFSDYNANVMDSATVLTYWCDPFTSSVQTAAVTERDVFTSAMPMALMGGRGTGKTMLLKYFSYPVQLERAKRESQENSREQLRSYFRARRALGFYLRIDGPVLRSFEGKALSQDLWNVVFCHYFEARVCRAYLEVARDLVARCWTGSTKAEHAFVRQAALLLGAEEESVASLNDLLSLVDDDIDAVTLFRSNIAFTNAAFHPRKAFPSQYLTFKLPALLKEHWSGPPPNSWTRS